MGEKRTSCQQAAGSGYLWVRCCGLAPAAEEVDVRQSCWDPSEVPVVKEVNAGVTSPRKGHSSSGTCSTFLLPEARPPQCWWCQDLRMPFFLSWDTDLKGVGTYYISHLLMHATYINIFKCLSWWMNNFHYLALVFSSGWSGIFKLFQRFAVCSSANPSGVVFWLDVFLLWSVALYQSSAACSGNLNCAFCPCTSLALCCSQTRLALGPQPLHSHRITGTFCCVNACSYLYNYREVTDCRGRFSNSDVTHLEDPDVALAAVFCSQPFCLAVLMMCEAHGRHCCSRSLLVFYSISPPGMSSEDAILICCKLLCILCMYCTLIHYFFRLI